MKAFPGTVLILSVGLLLGGCQSAYYATMEKFGVEKRDIMVDRVEDARDAQEETKEEFADALEQFSALVNYEGDELEKVYDKLKAKFEDSEAAANEVRDRIRSIESVSTDLFREWDEEIEQYTSANLKRMSRDARLQTEESYLILIKKMKAAEATMYPVLDLFRDQVLFLKHNLNARAIASLDTEASAIEEEVRKLIEEMNASIAEADAFIASMK
ncbi:MAG: DUF2959 domain-containing protein [Puniceicoccaceae bacterium]